MLNIYLFSPVVLMIKNFMQPLFSGPYYLYGQTHGEEISKNKTMGIWLVPLVVKLEGHALHLQIKILYKLNDTEPIIWFISNVFKCDET